MGFATGEPLYLVFGATAYVLGWVYLPDLKFFRNWAERRTEASTQAEANAEVAQFTARRSALIQRLTPTHRASYFALSKVCEDIATASTIDHIAGMPSSDPRIRKLEELMWTYLRLLTIEESLEQFLESEARDNVPQLLAEAEAQTAQLRTEVEELRRQPPSSALDARERLLESRSERMETLRKRQDRYEQARHNLALVIAEEERLDQQIKLIRADSIATRNTAALSARIDATVEHLEHTHRWLSEMDEFKDLLTDLPPGERRVGFGEPVEPPPLPVRSSGRKQERTRS